MAKYLITGAAGFIASRVATMLLDSGHSVIGIDNLNDAYDVRIKDYRLKLLQAYPAFSFHRLDIARNADLTQALSGESGIAGVINLAARAGVRASLENPWSYYDTNLTGTLNLLELCRQQGIPKFVLASTSSVYGSDAPQPTPETANTNHPLQPYAASKKAAEVLSYTYHYLFDLDVTVVRYFTVYGPAGRPDMSMFRFCLWITEGRPVRVNGDGSQSRGFTYVDDIARGTIASLKPLGYQIINLGGHEVISINELISTMETMIGNRARIERFPRHPADAFTSWASVEKASRLLDWEPEISLAEGISRLVAWYQAERSWAKGLETG